MRQRDGERQRDNEYNTKAEGFGETEKEENSSRWAAWDTRRGQTA